MAQYDLIMPKMGESITEATILKWLKKEGDAVSIDEAVLEIATDKVDSEVPSQVSGTISKILFKENDVVEVGKVLAHIEIVGAETKKEAAAPSAPVQQAVAVAANATSVVTSAPKNNGASSKFYSPLVLSIASTEGVSMTELENISGTGAEGRVTKKDILNHVANRSAAPAVPPISTPTVAPVAQTASTTQVVSSPRMMDGREEIIEMDRMRKIIAENMVRSKHTAPHVTSFVEADVTNIVKWREKVKSKFEKREGTKLTYTPIFIEAIVKAIKDFPMINVSIDGDKIIKKNYINIGMAAALPSGNLILPIIHNADMLNLTGLAHKVNDLAERARTNKLKAEDIQGGTYTISNVGTFGNWMGTPIIPLPQVAIMAVGAIVKKPAVIETPEGDFIGIRHKMFLSHSYDHRVVDGALGGMFVRRVADYLEGFDINREF